MSVDFKYFGTPKKRQFYYEKFNSYLYLSRWFISIVFRNLSVGAHIYSLTSQSIRFIYVKHFVRRFIIRS